MKALSGVTAVLISGLIGLSAQAKPPLTSGTELGNGGDVIGCQSVEYTTLDIYEAISLRGLPFTLTGSTYQEMVNQAIDRLERLSPRRAALYRERLNTFLAESIFVPNAKLTDINDSSHVAIPADCWIEQAVIQQTPQFPEDKRYIFSKDIWDRLSDQSKAALVLHELIYREAIEFGAKNSISSRYFNSVLFSDKILTVSLRDFIDILYAIPFRYAEYGTSRFELYERRNSDTECEGNERWDGRSPIRPTFFDENHIESASTDCMIIQSYGGDMVGEVEHGKRVYFYPNGTPTGIYFVGTVQMPLPGQSVVIPIAWNVLFHENGFLKYVWAKHSNTYWLESESGISFCYKSERGFELKFNEMGKLINWEENRVPNSECGH